MSKGQNAARFGLPMCLVGMIATPAMAQEAAVPPAEDQPAIETPAAQSAAEGTQGGVEEIVVTAQRRSESVQDIPLSITAVTGNQLRATGVTDVVGLGNRMANVNINVVQNIVRINIRGIGTNAVTPITEGSVAFHVDGVYITRPEAQAAAFFDVQRVEVLRGPQGILYGRNATGGAVNVITGQPTDELDGYAQLTLGNYSTILTEGAIGGPLSDGVSARVAFQTSNHEGYLTQLFGVGGVTERDIGDLNTRAVRAQLRFEPTPDLSFTFSGDYFYQSDASAYLVDFGPGDNGVPNLTVSLGGGTPSPDVRVQYGNQPNTVDKRNWGIGLTGIWDITPNATLTSITAYRRYSYDYFMDYDQTEAAGAIFGAFNDSESTSQELRLSGSTGRLNYVLGAYYLSSLVDYTQASTRNRFYFGGPDLQVNGIFNMGKTDTVALAGFGQVGYDINDWLGIDLGLRYSWERQIKRDEMLSNSITQPLDINGPHNFTTIIPFARVSFDSWTPKATVRITPVDDVMIYASYSRGFRSGGFSIGAGTAPPFAPEELTSYEVGIRSQFLDNRLQANVSAFLYDYSNLQVRRALPNGQSILESAGSAEAYGIEAEIIAIPVDDLRINLDVGLLNTEFKEYSTTDGLRPALGVIDLSGNRFLDAPPYRINLGVEYTWHPSWGDVTLRGEARYTGRTYYTPFNTEPYSQAPYDLYDVFLNYTSPDRKWFGGLFVRNIENDDIQASGIGATLQIGGYVQGVLLPPRTFGIRLGRRF